MIKIFKTTNKIIYEILLKNRLFYEYIKNSVIIIINIFFAKIGLRGIILYCGFNVKLGKRGDLMSKWFSHITNKINNNPYIISIKTASIKLLPLTVLIAFTTLIMSFSTFIYPTFYENIIYDILAKTKLALTVAFPYVAVVIMTHSLQRIKKGRSDMTIGVYPVIGLILFNMIVDGTLVFGLDIKFLRAILVGIFTYEYEDFIDRWLKKIKYKWATDVFVAFTKSLILLLSISIFSYFFYNYNIQLDLDPSRNIEFTNNIFDAYKYLLVILTPWIIGINGSHLVSEAYTTLYNNYLINQELLSLGQGPEMIFEFTFFNYYLNIGGSGATLCLVIALFLSKKKAHKRFARIALLPSIFNINEIVIFGFPILANFHMIIPFVTVPMIFATITYVALSNGIVPIAINQTSWIMPPILNIFLATNGNIRAILLQIFLIIIGTMIYSYFLKRYTGDSIVTLPDQFVFLKPSQNVSQISDMQLNIYKEVNEAKQNLNPLLDNGEFILYYQPIYNVELGKIDKVEGLIRIKHREKGIIPPYFLQYFEKLGMMKEVDYWVLERVLKDIKYFRYLDENIEVAINISTVTFNDDKFISNLKRILYTNKVNYKNITIELVEESFIDDFIGAREKLKELKGLGLKIAIDDFGTGYSSLGYLMELDVDIIKIDRKFILATNTLKGKELMKNIINMTKDLGCKVVVEGVEKEEEMKFVESQGADYIQGFYYSKPLEIKELTSYLKNSKKHLNN